MSHINRKKTDDAENFILPAKALKRNREKKARYHHLIKNKL